MKKIMILVFGFAGLAVQAQKMEMAHERRNEFKAQMARTPWMNWVWSDSDSLFAYQDTIDGVARFFMGDYTDEEAFERIYTIYDWDMIVDGVNDELVFRDWNSFNLDSGYAFPPLYQQHRSIADSLGGYEDTLMGYSWSLPYENEFQTVRLEEVFLERSWEEDGTVELHMVYTKLYTIKEEDELRKDSW
jgi:hypothetical protein